MGEVGALNSVGPFCRFWSGGDETRCECVRPYFFCLFPILLRVFLEGRYIPAIAFESLAKSSFSLNVALFLVKSC